MQRRTNRHQLRLVTEMSITPVLNLVFILILLLLFMIAGPLVQEGHALASPAAAGKAPEAPPQDIAKLTVDKSHAISLEGRPVAPADLNAALAQLVKDRPRTGVLVQIHRDLPVQVLVDLMDSLRQAGVQKTAVATEEK